VLEGRVAGARVVVNDIGPATVDVVEEVLDQGGTALTHTGDVGDWSSAEALTGLAAGSFGRLDVLVNVGISRPAMNFNMTEQDWDDVIRVNLKGSIAPIRLAAAHRHSWAKSEGRPRQCDGRRTSSDNGLNGGTPGQVNYSVTKTGDRHHDHRPRA
jgi:NAD(P)-dependent dehydrogenase (short-subunit alcohol dehydrogenase family)